MFEIISKTRFYDFKAYYKLYQLGLNYPFVADIYVYFARYGIVFFFLSFAYLIWVKRINAFICSFLAMGLAGFADILIFLYWKRPRPFVTYSNIINPQVEGMRIDSSSFPSSHTYIVFAIATSVFLYGHKRLGTALFVLAIFVAVGRVGAGLHYPSDVIGGAGIGIASGIISYILVRRWQKNWIGIANSQ